MREEKFVLVIDIEKSKSYIFRNIFETVTYFFDKLEEIDYVRKIQRTRLHIRTNLKLYQIKRDCNFREL